MSIPERPKPSAPTPEQQQFANTITDVNAALAEGVRNLTVALQPAADALRRDLANFATAMQRARQRHE